MRVCTAHMHGWEWQLIYIDLTDRRAVGIVIFERQYRIDTEKKNKKKTEEKVLRRSSVEKCFSTSDRDKSTALILAPPPLAPPPTAPPPPHTHTHTATWRPHIRVIEFIHDDKAVHLKITKVPQRNKRQSPRWDNDPPPPPKKKAIRGKHGKMCPSAESSAP